MKNPAHNQFLLIGLPSTGKTSFLAALWYMVGQSSVPCGLTLERLDGSSQYLNQIRDAWSKYKPVPRNKADSLNSVSMLLKSRATGQVARSAFPDLLARPSEHSGLDESSPKPTTGASARLRVVICLSALKISDKPHRIDTVECGPRQHRAATTLNRARECRTSLGPVKSLQRKSSS